MDASFNDETVVVLPEEPTIDNDVIMHSKTASRRTVAKYLKRKCQPSKVRPLDVNILKNEKLEDSVENSYFIQSNHGQPSFSLPFPNENFNKDLPPLIFPSALPTFVNNFNIEHTNYNEENQENNNSLNDIFKCVLEGNKGFAGSAEKNSEFPPSWLMNRLPFTYCDQPITSSSLSASIDKQEREIAYNLLIRKIIDETLDRNVIFSHQPKELLNLINSILVRQFSEYEETKHRCKVRSYLKACRRNSKKNNGKILMKNTAAYLSSGPGNRLMHQIYNNEKETINVIKKESERIKLAQINKQTTPRVDILISSPSKVSSTQQKHVFSISNSLPPILPVSISAIHASLKPIAQIYTANSNIKVTQLPLLMPFNSTIHTESVKKTSIKSECSSSSEEIIKNISEIAKTFLDKDSSVNVPEIVNQLKATANFLDKIAKTLEQYINNDPN